MGTPVIKIGGKKVKGAFVTRLNHSDGSWDETEFSFKMEQKDDESKWLRPAAGWDNSCLRELAKVYQELFSISSVFIQSPSIFYFHKPASSQDIALV